MRYILTLLILLNLVDSSKAETFSVFGNSISTFKGYIPDDYRTWFTPSMMNVEETWWYQVGEAMRWELCNNSSWSGSRVAYDMDWDYNSYFISHYRLNNLSKNGVPDNILVLGGVNDWRWNISKLGVIDSNDSTEFCGAYKLMIDRLKQLYPQTKIYCFSILPISENGSTEYSKNLQDWSIIDANECIKQICSLKDVQFINMDECEFANNVSLYTEDGLHPNVIGMKHIAEFVVAKLNESRSNPSAIIDKRTYDIKKSCYFGINGIRYSSLSQKSLMIKIDKSGKRKKIISR